MKFIIIVFLSLFLTGCAGFSMSKEDCLSRDWAGIGVNDGAKGENNFNRYKNACAESEVSLSLEDEKKYLSSWSDSFKVRFCTEKMAYKKGLNLKSFESFNGCSRTQKLSEVYTKGRTRGTLVKQIEDLKQRTRELSSSVDTLKRKEGNNKDEIHRLEEQMMSLKKEIRMLERELSKTPVVF